MSVLIWEVVFILVLIIGNGILAMAEIAIVASKRNRLQHLAQQGDLGASKALELAKDPNEFLSTVQIGITLVGILAGVFGGATIAEQLAHFFGGIELLAPIADSLSLGLVVIVITFCSLIIGELVPKRVGLAMPEKIASLVARPMKLLSRLMQPIVSLLSYSTELVLRVFRVKKPTEQGITEEELSLLIRQAAQTGILETVERDIVERALHLGDRRVASIMTPRPDVEWVDLAEPEEESIRKIAESVHSRFPAGYGRLNEFKGIITESDLFEVQVKTGHSDLQACLKMPIFVPEAMNLLRLLEELKKAKTELTIVVDEYGTITGLVTLKDVLETIVGDVPAQHESQEVKILRRADGTWLVDGAVSLEEFEEATRVSLSVDAENRYYTIAGFLLAKMGHLPVVGDKIEAAGFRFEVVDMDKNRIDKLLLTPLKKGPV